MKSHHRLPRTPTNRSLGFRRALHKPQALKSRSSDALLDQFWKAQGVFDESDRSRLVEIAQDVEPGDAVLTAAALPSVPATWNRPDSAPLVREVSRRLVALRVLLGGREDVDVVWMVTREPGLLAADFDQLTSRLLDMRLAAASAGLDVAKVVEAQPALLLADDWRLVEEGGNSLGGQAASSSSSSDSSSSSSTAGDGNVQDMQRAWQHGLPSDSEATWGRRHAQLLGYRDRHGDTCVGFGREGDDGELARWCTKQRADYKTGTLGEAKRAALEAAGFEWEADEADWLRWYAELRRFHLQYGHPSPQPLAQGVDMYLINWCSVQRVAKRCGVLSARRVGRLDDIGFDWSGADPLS